MWYVCDCDIRKIEFGRCFSDPAASVTTYNGKDLQRPFYL
jgi:hypothetical protein